MKERYLHSVRLLLDCSPEERERLLSRLNCAISSYLEDVSDATEIDLVTNFGTPEDCAARLLEECTPITCGSTSEEKLSPPHYNDGADNSFDNCYRSGSLSLGAWWTNDYTNR